MSTNKLTSAEIDRLMDAVTDERGFFMHCSGCDGGVRRNPIEIVHGDECPVKKSNAEAGERLLAARRKVVDVCQALYDQLDKSDVVGALEAYDDIARLIEAKVKLALERGGR